MSFHYNLARMTTATTGTGTVTLGAAVLGFLSFADAGVPDGTLVSYAIEDGTASEVGRGVYTSSGTTLTRATVLSSTNSGSALNLSGNAEVFLLAAAQDLKFPSIPQGRLTLTSNTPVLSSGVTNAATIYYTPYIGRGVPLYDGSKFQMHDFGAQLSQALTDNTKSPAAAATSTAYDMLVWCDAGTYRCTRGAAWSSSTSRGTGAGTAEIEVVNGFEVNKVAVTNGPGAQRGLVVGTIYVNSSGGVTLSYGGTAVGGTEAIVQIRNRYNRVPISLRVSDSTDSWSYTTASWRQVNGASTMRASLMTGDASTGVFAVHAHVAGTSSATARMGIGVDSTTAISGTTGSHAALSASTQTAVYAGHLSLGYHYLAALELGGTGVTFYGDAGGSNLQSGLSVWYDY